MLIVDAHDLSSGLLVQLTYPSLSASPMAMNQYRIFVCTKQRPANESEGCCADCGGLAVYKAFEQAIAHHNLSDRVQVKASGCLDHCTNGVVAMVFQPTQRIDFFDWPFLPKKLRHKLNAKIQKKIAPNRVFYGNLTPDDVPHIVEQHLIGQQLLHAKVVQQS